MKRETVYTGEAAELMGLSPSSVKKLIKAKKLKAWRYGKGWHKIYVSSIEKHMARTASKECFT